MRRATLQAAVALVCIGVYASCASDETASEDGNDPAGAGSGDEAGAGGSGGRNGEPTNGGTGTGDGGETPGGSPGTGGTSNPSGGTGVGGTNAGGSGAGGSEAGGSEAGGASSGTSGASASGMSGGGASGSNTGGRGGAQAGGGQSGAGNTGGSGNAGGAGGSGNDGGKGGSGSLLFFDDFEDGDPTGWTTNIGTSWGVLLIDGNRVYRQWDLYPSILYSVAGDAAWTDQILEVKVTPRTQQGLGIFGVIARYQASNNMYQFRVGTSNSCSFRSVVGGVSTTLGSATLDVVLNLPYVLRVEATGSTFRCYVNDTLLITATDSSHTRGSIGVLADGMTVDFDNVRVTRP